MLRRCLMMHTCRVGSAVPAALKCVAAEVPGVSDRVQSDVHTSLYPLHRMNTSVASASMREFDDIQHRIPMWHDARPQSISLPGGVHGAESLISAGWCERTPPGTAAAQALGLHLRRAVHALLGIDAYHPHLLCCCGCLQHQSLLLAVQESLLHDRPRCKLHIMSRSQLA